MLTALTLCALAAPQQAPFALELPPAYGAFERAAEGENWSSMRNDGNGRFEIRLEELATPGAQAELVAEFLREERWRPVLRGTGHKIKAWKGDWSGETAAGSSIDFIRERKPWVIEQRVLVLDDHLVVGTWEGSLGERRKANAALASFELPAAWRPVAAPQEDAQRGLGPLAIQPPAIGHYRILATLQDPLLRSVEFTLEFFPDKGTDPGTQGWMLPEGAMQLEASALKVRYRVDLYDDTRPVPAAGLLPSVHSLSALGGGWLAFPKALVPVDGRLAPPTFQLEVRLPSQWRVLHALDPVEEEVHESLRRVLFPVESDGIHWPAFAIGFYEVEKIGDRQAWIRRSARATRSAEVLRVMDRLQLSLQDWMPAAPSEWRIATFPGSGDLVLPGLFVFDEAGTWLSDPLDREWVDGNRRTGLARKLAYHCFGVHLIASGSGAAFLDASLAEYSAWRLLEGSGFSADASAIEAFWKRNEELSGPLPRPLTMMPLEDLVGGRRLLSRGALVWRAIEREAGRALLDGVLQRRVQRGGSWTTEDLRRDLEKATDRSWLPFFRAHVYGRLQP